MEYATLGLGARLDALCALVHAALDGPSVRACLDGRVEESQRVRKLLWDEAKASPRPFPIYFKGSLTHWQLQIAAQM